MKLKPKMLLGIGIPLLIVFIIMGIIIYRMASAGLREATEVGMEQRASRYAEVIDGNISEDAGLLEALSIGWSEGMPEGEQLQAEVDELGPATASMASSSPVPTARARRARSIRRLGIRARATGTRRRLSPTAWSSPKSTKTRRTVRSS